MELKCTCTNAIAFNLFIIPIPKFDRNTLPVLGASPTVFYFSSATHLMDELGFWLGIFPGGDGRTFLIGMNILYSKNPKASSNIMYRTKCSY